MKTCVPQEKVVEAFAFAQEFISNGKSGKDFGSPLIRSDEIRVIDCALGVVGEAAFCQMAERYGVELKSDRTIRYGSNEGDNGQDIKRVIVYGEKRTLLPKIDIKTSKAGAGWLLVEKYRLQASIFLLMCADVPRQKMDMGPAPIDCEAIGYAFYEDFFGGDGLPLFNFKGGSKLLRSSVAEQVLQGAKTRDRAGIEDAWRKLSPQNPCIDLALKCSDQCGLPRGALRKDFDRLFSIIKGMSLNITN